MKFYDFGIVILIVVVSLSVIGGIASKVFLGSDNAIEEVAEEVIEKEIGLDIDLSPETKESPEQK